MQQFGTRLRQARRARGWTQPELAQLAGLKAPHLISYLERGGRAGVQADTVYRLAVALEVSTDWLLGVTHTDEAEDAA